MLAHELVRLPELRGRNGGRHLICEEAGIVANAPPASVKRTAKTLPHGATALYTRSQSAATVAPIPHVVRNTSSVEHLYGERSPGEANSTRQLCRPSLRQSGVAPVQAATPRPLQEVFR